MNLKDALRKGFTHLPCTLHNHRWCLLTQSKSLIHAALLRVPVHIKADEMQRQWIFVCHANWLPVNVGARADAAFVLKYTAFIMCWFFFVFIAASWIAEMFLAASRPTLGKDSIGFVQCNGWRMSVTAGKHKDKHSVTFSIYHILHMVMVISFIGICECSQPPGPHQATALVKQDFSYEEVCSLHKGVVSCNSF